MADVNDTRAVPPLCTYGFSHPVADSQLPDAAALAAGWRVWPLLPPLPPRPTPQPHRA